MFRTAARHDPLCPVPDTEGRDGRSTRWDAHRARRREQVVDAALAVLAAPVGARVERRGDTAVLVPTR